MKSDSLQALHEAAGASLTDKSGARVPAHFGNPEAEYRTLREDAGVLDLAWLGVLELAGPDREQFLSGMVSNEVRNLGTAGGCHATVLTIHGKMVADVVVVSFDDRFLVLTGADRAAVVAEYLDRYLIADEVEISNRSEEYGVLAVSGPAARALFEEQGWSVPDALWSHAPVDEGIEAIRWQLSDEPSWALLAERGRLPALWRSLVAAGAKPVGLDALNVARIEAGIPWYGVDAADDSIPLESGFDDTISTSKGCFLGQETIIRIMHRGHVNKRLYGLILDGDEVPPNGADVSKDGKPVGTISSAARSPKLGAVVAMGVLRVRAVEEGGLVRVSLPGGMADARVVELPFAG